MNETVTFDTASSATARQLPDVLYQAEQAIDVFMGLVNDEYKPLAESMFEAAKNLYTQVSHHWSVDKHHFGKREWDASDLAQDLHNLQSVQQPLWEKLLKGAYNLREKVGLAYKKVEDADAAVVEACAYDSSSSVASSKGCVSPETQQYIRRYHSKKLGPEMHEAKLKYQELCGYPDGLLTRIDAMHKRVAVETESLIEKTAKKEDGHHRLF